MTLANIKTEFEKYMVLRDKYIIEMLMATIIGNTILPRDPVWLLIVGVSSGGKTMLISPCSGIKSCHFVDDLTEKTFLSGFKGVKGKETSLLKIIGSGIMLFSDFTSILTKNSASRGEILTQLKLVYDGHLTKYTGTGVFEWIGKMGFIGASTPDIYSYLEAGRSLGERFTYYWLDVPTDSEIAAKQKDIKLSSKEISDTMKDFYAEYIKTVIEWVDKNGIPELALSDSQREAIRQAAIFCVNGKATIRTDWKSGKPDAMPNRAGVGRDIKMLETILHALQLMKCVDTDNPKAKIDNDMINIVRKCAYSSITRERRMILEILAAVGKPLSASQLGAIKGFGLPRESVEKYLLPLNAVGLIQKQVQKNRHYWFIDESDTEIIDFIKKVMGNVEFDVPEEPSEEDEYLGQGTILSEDKDFKDAGF